MFLNTGSLILHQLVKEGKVEKSKIVSFSGNFFFSILKRQNNLYNLLAEKARVVVEGG